MEKIDNHWGVYSTPEGAVGFVYRIELDDRWYIGKKRVVRVAKNRKVYPNNEWKFYTGSSKELNSDIAKSDIEPKCEILQWCGMLSELNYAEVMWQINTNAVRDPTCYNKQIGSFKMYHAKGWWMDRDNEEIN